MSQSKPRPLVLALLILPLLPLAGPSLAEPPHHPACEAKADAIATQLEHESGAPLSPSERGVARRAALASCLEQMAGTQQVALAEPKEPAEAEKSRFQRFLAGLFSTETEPAKKRSGKYRYIDKE